MAQVTEDHFQVRDCSAEDWPLIAVITLWYFIHSLLPNKEQSKRRDKTVQNYHITLLIAQHVIILKLILLSKNEDENK